jgi:hypothetical protein
MQQEAHQVARREDLDSWNAWADGRIAAALERHEKIFTDAVGEALDEIREGLRNEFWKELEAATAKLGVELREPVAGLRTELARLETELAGHTARIRITNAWTSSRWTGPATSLGRTALVFVQETAGGRWPAPGPQDRKAYGGRRASPGQGASPARLGRRACRVPSSSAGRLIALTSKLRP